jgi:type IV pilus secretin PilQ/predicted competence protein
MKIYWRAIGPGGLYLIGAALMPLLAVAQAAQTPVAAPSAATSVAQVEIDRDGQQTAVRVESGNGGGPLSYHILRLSDPARVVVDFDHAHLAVTRNAIPSSYGPVQGVRLSQFRPDQVRLVIDLDHRAAYSLENGEQSMAVKFADSAAQPAVVVAQAAASKLSVAAKQQTVANRVSAREFALPATLTGAAAPLARPVPQTVSAPATSQPTLSAAVQPQAAAPAQVAVQGQPNYTGEPISVNLKDVDLKDFFRLIHEISGLNVVLDPSVQGRVTLVLDEVPWDQALEIVMRNNGLAKEVNGNVLRIASQDTLRKEAEQKRDLAKAEAEAVDPVTATRVLSYAKATDITNTLKRFLSSRGDIIADERSNSLIIRDIPASLPQIDDLIRQLDRKTQQVGIEARVVSASRSFARDIGTQFGFSTTFGNNAIGGAQAVGSSPLSVTSLAPPLVSGSGAASSLPLLSSFPAGAPTSGFSFANRSPNFALDYIITAAESKGVGKLLSSPQLVTQNNAKAVVKQGTKVPIQTTINNTVSVQYIDAVLQLQVTPQITAEGTIFMDVLVENTQIDPGIARVQGIPALDTQSAETKVLINDGGTVVIGGVMTSQQTTTVQEVPLVGSLPLIGHLFKRTAVNVSSQELLFFLTPRIMPG